MITSRRGGCDRAGRRRADHRAISRPAPERSSASALRNPTLLANAGEASRNVHCLLQGPYPGSPWLGSVSKIRPAQQDQEIMGRRGDLLRGNLETGSEHFASIGEESFPSYRRLCPRIRVRASNFQLCGGHSRKPVRQPVGTQCSLHPLTRETYDTLDQSGSGMRDDSVPHLVRNSGSQSEWGRLSLSCLLLGDV